MQINIKKYVSEVASEIITEMVRGSEQKSDETNVNSRILLEAPTGSGKSSFILEVLPATYNKILVVSPIRLITDQHSKGTAFESLENIIDITTKDYLAVTTDTLYNLYLRKPKEVMKYLSEVPLVVFDEQHIINTSFGFRPKVIKAVELIESSVKTLLYLSGTPDVVGMNNLTGSSLTGSSLTGSSLTGSSLKHIKVVSEKNYTVTVFNNTLKDTAEVTSKVMEELTRGSVLLYVASTTKVKEASIRFKNYPNVVILDKQEVYQHLPEATKELKSNKLFISTSRATAGLNFKGLCAVFQYGSVYNTNNLVQLISRLRDTGNYYYIRPRYENNLSDLRMVQLESLLGVLKSNFNLARDFYTEVKPLVDKNEILLSSCTANGFIKGYSKALELAEALGYLDFNTERDDFTISEIKDFIGTKNKLLRKEMAKSTVDKLIEENKFETLNNSYNLAFKIKSDISSEVLSKRVELITINDKIDKKERNTKKNADELDFLGKTELISIASVKTLRNNFTQTELKALARNKNINIKRLQEIKNEKDRVLALKCYLIPKRIVFGIISKLLQEGEGEFVKVIAVDSALSRKYSNTDKLTKTPYMAFIIDLLESPFNDSDFVYKEVINNKKLGRLRKVITQRY